jgi:uncharacterized repeat protein (TIGR03803 family)
MKKLFFILTFTIFGISASAQYTKLLDFNDTNGRYPNGSLYYDGIFLYGMTEYGGIKDTGTIFKIKPDGSGYVKLLDFTGFANGSRPHGSLISDGTFLYGTTMNGGINNLGTIFKIKTDGSGYVKLLDFANVTNGSNPSGSLIFDGSFLYGVTGYGGIKDSGTIYKIKPDGSSYVKIFDFAGDTNGTVPYGYLFYDGTFLYGMTGLGGNKNNCGTIYKIKPDGSGYIKLYNFPGPGGGYYSSSLISDGTFLYGTMNYYDIEDYSEVFKIKPDGSGYMDLFGFGMYFEVGSSPIFNGNYLYGMTLNYGTNGYGNIFRIKPDSSGYTDLLDFAGATNGSDPLGSLITDGTFFYGMTYTGGAYNDGVIFKYKDTATVGLNDINENNNNIAIYPNPNNGNMQVAYKIPENTIGTFIIYDLIGKQILSYPLNSGKNTLTISANDIDAGVYFYRAIAGNKVIAKDKIVVIK